MAKVNVNVDAIKQCQVKGMTQSATAKELGISLTAVCYHWDKKSGLGRPRGKSENTKRIALLVDQGMSDREIAEHLDIAVSTVNRTRRKIAQER
ncbi:helix-turn-helix domain-containing protein [Salmonella enterica]|nr:helix-turn-helix domain-containing protein [Salmonella enterica]